MPYTISTEQMLRQQMQVTAITEHTVVLTVCRPEVCQSVTCCQAILGERKKPTMIARKSQLADSGLVQLGDTFEVTIAYRHCLFAALLLYGLPLMLLLIAAGTVHAMGYGDGFAALCSGLGMLLGFVVARCVTQLWFSVTYLRIV